MCHTFVHLQKCARRCIDMMSSPRFLSPWLPLMLIILSISSSIAAPINGRILEEDPNLAAQKLQEALKHVKTYNQTLDHFNYVPQSYATFQQRYLMKSEHWGGANTSSPIFVYLGSESALIGQYMSSGFPEDNAAHFKALVVYIEHRYYGQSIPFGSREEAFKNASTMGYFNSAQALADYAEIIMHIKKEHNAPHSPVIVFGGSYGGMLAAWFRLKYPHVAWGAVASSAPFFTYGEFSTQEGIFPIVDKTYKETSETCHRTIQQSWAEINKIGSQPNGLSILSMKFKTCQPLTDAEQLKQYLGETYILYAQMDNPPQSPMINILCGAIDGSKSKDILGKIFDGLSAMKGGKNDSCTSVASAFEGLTDTYGWKWQTCTEMLSKGGAGPGKGTMFEPSPSKPDELNEGCEGFGVPFRLHWLTTYYGFSSLQEAKLTLKRFGSNIVFSNGLRDPLSAGSVLEKISNSILAVNADNGNHCIDMGGEKQGDPKWLTEQRRKVVKIIKRWIEKYYAELKALHITK